VYLRPELDSPVVAQLPAGVALRLGAELVMGGRTWIAVAAIEGSGYVPSASAREHTTLASTPERAAPAPPETKAPAVSGGFPLGLMAAIAAGWFLMGHQRELGGPGAFIVVLGAIAVAAFTANTFRNMR
jgi:hypothetical protein